MIKTTNLEISKKLKEIGFKNRFSFCWSSHNNFEEPIDIYSPIPDGTNEEEFVPAYDLETLLEAMPTCIKPKKKLYHLWLGGKGIGYYPEVNSDRYCGGNIVYDMDDSILISFNNDYKKWDESLDESLADTAGRLIIQLHEKGLIKLGGKK
jgi:hypothetical protein